MTNEQLVAVHGDRVAATVERRGDRLGLEYDRDWRRDGPFPLSLSMPTARGVHEDAVVASFLSNLLPDNARVLEAWGRRFHVSARSPFRLLLHVGEDCAGAFAFVEPSRVDAFRRARGSIHWLSEADIADRLAALRSDVSAWRLATDTGQFSLAGAHPKIALTRRGRRWGIPSGAVPTTHILKPPIEDLEGHAENEHYCLALARRLGLPAVRSTVERFGDEVAIVVERFDRTESGGVIRRLHQEDLCQALAVPPERKYQNEGGPTPRAVAELLRRHSRAPAEDIATFRDALLVQWLIAGPDAHAKNFALLHGTGGGVRLAPLYDLASALPYPSFDRRRLKLAMKMGGTYRMAEVGARDIAKLGEGLGLDPTRTVGRARELTEALPAAARAVGAAMAKDGVEQPIIETLARELVARAEECARGVEEPHGM